MLVTMSKSQAIKYQTLAKRENRKKKRIFEIDFLRGFDLILMIAIHFCFAASNDGIMGMLFDKNSQHNGTIEAMNRFCGNVFWGIVNATGTRNPFGPGVFHLLFLELFFSGLFIFLSGISCSFAKNNLKRGVQLAYVAELMTVVLIVASYIAKNCFDIGSNHFPAICIICGILHSIAIALIIYSIFDHFFPGFYQTFIAAIILSVFAIITTYFYADAKTGIIHSANLPKDWWKLLLGLARYGDDYFSPVQVTATLFLGASFGKLFYAKKKSLLPENMPTKWAKPILFLGKHSLLIYVCHQPFMYIIMAIVYLLCGYKVV